MSLTQQCSSYTNTSTLQQIDRCRGRDRAEGIHGADARAPSAKASYVITPRTFPTTPYTLLTLNLKICPTNKPLQTLILIDLFD